MKLFKRLGNRMRNLGERMTSDRALTKVQIGTTMIAQGLGIIGGIAGIVLGARMFDRMNDN